MMLMGVNSWFSKKIIKGWNGEMSIDNIKQVYDY